MSSVTAPTSTSKNRLDFPTYERPSKKARVSYSVVEPLSPAPSPHRTDTTPQAFPLASPSSFTPPQGDDNRALVPFQPASDYRRLSVNSLLSEESPSSHEEILREATGSYLRLDTRSEHLRSTTYYGIDRGFRDLDVGSNDDINAISGSSPKLSRSSLHMDSSEDEEGPFEFGFGVHWNDVERKSGGYYDQPVVIRIPRCLEPLPSKLKDNPMNVLVCCFSLSLSLSLCVCVCRYCRASQASGPRLTLSLVADRQLTPFYSQKKYFHHFLNHTARVLVPHDDPQSNPFRTILPQMAVRNDNLLSLLLAYSASHRARLLQQPEPATRIALWVQDVFPALRLALDDPTQKISNANVATAIMLASLEIISPTAFGYEIPWQRHLLLARDLITARPEGLRVEHHSSQEGQVCSFLWSWFAYLDVLGSLSGGPKDASPIWILDYKVYDPDDDDEIDCIMGFTTRCIYILARVAELARQCDARRIDPATGRPRRGWAPGAATAARAVALEADVRESMALPPRACAHIHRSGDVERWDRAEMSATNEAYHWAALVHLHRRVLGKPSHHCDVQDAVRNVTRCLGLVRRGGTAEACLLFPMFTAGCDTADGPLREAILSRMATVESTGMTQVSTTRSGERAWGVYDS